jgi:16S rRNA (cytosine967-C5)-methyltransferase
MSVGTRPGLAPGAQAMALAAQALHRVSEQGANADATLDTLLSAAASSAATLHTAPLRAPTRALLAGSLRFLLRLAPAADALLQPGQQYEPLLRALIIVALHQIEYSQSAPPVVVNIAVDAARALGRAGAAGFINALLRRYLAQREALLARVDRSEAARLAHPRWLLRALHELGESAAQAAITANNEAPAMTLRVNLSRLNRETALQNLAAASIAAQPGLAPTALVLDEPIDVMRLPGFAEGELSVQDAGAQFAAPLLDAQPGQRVLDACAAPGGKTGHILERTPNLAELVALDISAARLSRVEENLQRLKLSATLLEADLLAADWWDGRRFDRILLDAPCSATGVIRRHPDIKLLRRAADIPGLAAIQRQMLERCAQLLAPGGLVVYATCSVLPAENNAVVEAFLTAHPDYSRARDDLWLLPAPRNAGAAALTDGFYYACLKQGT